MQAITRAGEGASRIHGELDPSWIRHHTSAERGMKKQQHLEPPRNDSLASLSPPL
jgi:hypothetical protein